MKRPWLYGKNKVSVFFKNRIFDKLYKVKKEKPWVDEEKQEVAVQEKRSVKEWAETLLLWTLYFINTVIMAPFLFAVLFYAGLLYLISLVLRFPRLALYARNLALGVWDQGLMTVWGGAPDLSISETLGLSKILHEAGAAHVSTFVLKFGTFVDFIFCNRLYCIEKNHIKSSIDYGESWKNTVSHWHKLKKPSDSQRRDPELVGVVKLKELNKP